MLKLERVQVICPACGQQVEAVATDGRVKEYCAAAKQNVDFPVTQGMAVPVGSQANAVASVTAATAVHTGKNLTDEHKTEISAPPNTFLFSLMLPPVVIPQESRISSGPIFGGGGGGPNRVTKVRSVNLLEVDIPRKPTSRYRSLLNPESHMP